MNPRSPPPLILYPEFPLSGRIGYNARALARSTSWAGSFLVKVALVIALAAVLGVLAGAALGFVVVIAMI